MENCVIEIKSHLKQFFLKLLWLQWKAWGLILLAHLCGLHPATGSGELQAASGPWDGSAQVWKKDQLCWGSGWKRRFEGFPAQQQPHPQIWGWLRGEKRFVSIIRLLYSQGLWSGAWFCVSICIDRVKSRQPWSHVASNHFRDASGLQG